MKKKKSNKTAGSRPDAQNPSVVNEPGSPETVTELLNKFGTYEIQPTADTENEFPTIAQGLPKDKKNKKE